MDNATRGIAKLEDVARLAEVSSATVSRFFNNPAVVAERTARRIESAIAQLGYVPNLLAGGLASSRSRLVAVFVPEVAHSLFNDTIESMVEALSADGYSVMLAMTRADNRHLSKLVGAALARRVDAVILTGVVTDEDTRDRLRAQKVTTIETWGLPSDPIDVTVGFSHRAVGQDLARFARQKGYRRPFLITAMIGRAKLRHDGFCEAWVALGGSPVEDISVPIPTGFGQGFAAFDEIARIEPRPDLVVCGSDWLALGMIYAAREAGLRVPDDLAVIGFGDLSIAAEMHPGITSVNIDGARIGREVADVLRRRANGEEACSRTDVSFRIVERESA